MRKSFLFLITFSVITFVYGKTDADSIKIKSYHPVRVSETPKIDGKIDVDEWKNVTWEGGFTQFKPENGSKPEQETEFAVQYDNNYLYVGIKALDNEPNKIKRQFSRRDNLDGDMVGIFIDSYHDKNTAFFFQVSAAGVQSDGVTTTEDDYTWDALWQSATGYDEKGWYTEMKIPFSQLRFAKADIQTWGFEILRVLYRKQEVDVWQPIKRDVPAFVASLGLLDGLEGIKPKKQVELMPYIVAQRQTYQKEEGNPFKTGVENAMNAGLDGKIGITNNMILDFTINPDFGQVESDPSEVNLTAYETYFSEKRPFFIEGRSITSMGVKPGNNMSDAENLFYSRRIGRAPRIDPSDYFDYDYDKTPKAARILGAFKLTGKTKDGLSLGIIESVTNQEFAKISKDGEINKVKVEPFTNYLIGRVKKEYNNGGSYIGAMATAVNRSLDEPQLLGLNKSAYTGGVDYSHSWKDRKYYLTARMMTSYVGGDTLAMQRMQKSPARYYQRTDAKYIKYDPKRTSLTGVDGMIQFGKQGNSKWLYIFFVNFISPGFETNDAGYLRKADEIFQVYWLGYRNYTKRWIIKETYVNFNQYSFFDFGLRNNSVGGNINSSVTFTNLWNAGFNISRDSRNFSNTLLRGGPSMIVPGNTSYSLWAGTNSSKKFYTSISFSQSIGDLNSNIYRGFDLSFNWNPISALGVSFYPWFSYSKNDLQYVSTEDYKGNNEYIFGRISQKTLVLPVRINLGITPTMTLQYYGQPFISAGKYDQFKRITNPVAKNYENRFEVFNSQNLQLQDDTYFVDRNTDGMADYSFDKPDYNAYFFLSNLVYRWEYKPGSTLYLVWSQGRDNYINRGVFSTGKDLKDVFSIYPNNVFLIKWSYRFSA
ncbi:conserved exported hypothetical protein [uncultured Paludibacter sp.]|uniref:Uncharacterized protein n=1 Tax=uncultured Paludibacter sp. TaxID=497635 RepID=A0A653ACE4_9BACT|nr:conserved exported hypothetical protein [uncultured Paludibacter sp.]